MANEPGYRGNLRATIVVPSITDFYFTRHRHSSLGAHVLFRLLTDRGVAVTLLDFPARARKIHASPIPRELDYLKPFILPDEYGPLSFFRRYGRLGPKPAIQAEDIAETGPDVIFLSCFAFAYAEDTIDLANAVRNRLNHIPIVAGGAGASVHPAYFLDNTSIDTVVTGPAEATVDSLIAACAGESAHLPRIIEAETAESGTIDFVASCREHTLTTLVTRGCPKRCRFCSVHLTQGYGYEKVSPEAFAHGLEQHRGCDIRTINFEDDSLLADSSYVKEILGIVRKFGRVELRAENGLDPAHLTEETLHLLHEAGLSHLNLSMASYSAASLLRENRKQVSDRLPKILARATELGMDATVFWICGLESDTRESVLRTLLYLADLHCESGISLFYAVPGLPGFIEREKFPRPEAPLTKGSSAFPWNGSLTTRQMVTAFRLSRFLSLQATSPDQYADLLQHCVHRKTLFTFQKHNGNRPVAVENTDHELVHDFFSAFRQPR